MHPSKTLWLALLAASSCRTPNAASLKDAAPPAASPAVAPQAAPTPEPDLPPVGRALFDYLMPQVPYPFETLVESLRQKSNLPLAGAMIPIGRSLQRLAASPNFFKYPRLVVAVPEPFILNQQLRPPTWPPTPPLPDPRWLLENRLFIGYVEPAKQLEVISYNELAGRFEFEIVTDYDAPPAVPKITYASRALCTACHQNHAPIFPTLEWAETTESEGLSGGHVLRSLIKSEVPDLQAYHDVPFVDDVPITAPVLATSVSIDSAAVAATNLLKLQVLWTDGCGRSAATASKCRGYLVRMMFDPQGSAALGASEMAELNAFLDAAAAAYLPNGLGVIGSQVPDYDPEGVAVKALGLDATATAFDAPTLAKIKQTMATAAIPPVFDPLVPRTAQDLIADFRTGDRAQFWSVEFGFALAMTALPQSDFATIRAAAGADGGKLKDAVAKMVAKTDAGQGNALGPLPFRRTVVLNALLAELGSTTLIPSYLDGAPALPAPVLESQDDVGMPDFTDPALALFGTYCSDCHADGPFAFLAGANELVVKAQVKSLASEIFKRLSWDSVPPPPKPMPPHTSAAYHQLNQTGAAANRQRMIDFVKAFVAP